MPSDGYEKLIRYAFNIISRKRYTESEMMKKLKGYKEKRSEIGEELVEKVFLRLKELKYLDDDLYAKDYLSSRVKSRPRGKSMIKFELIRKGVSKEHIERALQDVEIDEGEIATSALSKKMRKWQELDKYKQKNKAYQFLYSKGFARESIYKAIKSCYDQLVS